MNTRVGRSILTASEDALLALQIAIEDICYRFTQFGETEDGDVAKYLVTKGTVHRLVAHAQSANISASLRAGTPDPPPEPGDDITALLYRQLGHAHMLIELERDRFQRALQQSRGTDDARVPADTDTGSGQ